MDIVTFKTMKSDQIVVKKKLLFCLFKKLYTMVFISLLYHSQDHMGK